MCPRGGTTEPSTLEVPHSTCRRRGRQALKILGNPAELRQDVHQEQARLEQANDEDVPPMMEGHVTSAHVS